MKTVEKNLEVKFDETITIEPLRIHQALIGLALDNCDDAILQYFGFLTGVVPTENACFTHVIPGIELFDEAKEEPGISLNYEVDQEIIDGVTTKIATLISQKNKVKVDIDVRDGNPLDELLQKAGLIESDLVVIGKTTHRDYHGILAKNFARKVECNALLVPDKANLTLKKILVPVDFSPASIKALRTAVALQKRLGSTAKVVALNVFELPPFQAYLIRRTPDELREVIMEDRQAAFKSFLKTYVPESDRKNIQTVIIEQKHPGVGNYILEYAENNKVDMIVMGAKGHSKMGLLLLGSVTEKVMTLVEKHPVLVVK
jgi:nucleotide-binding universal stress UspA family protein